MSRFLRLIDKSEEGHSVSECTSMPDEKKGIVHFEMSLLVDINAKGRQESLYQMVWPSSN